jgi:hypothetical protein
LFLIFTIPGYLNKKELDKILILEIFMSKSDDALTAFKSGFTCSSAVVSAFSDELGFDGETAKKIACGFGAGISKSGNICGAISGAIMVNGLKYGKTHP